MRCDRATPRERHAPAERSAGAIAYHRDAMVYEHRSQPLLSRPRFGRRLAAHALLVLGLIGGTLAIGMLGYHGLEGLGWLDAFLNAAMLLGGMGPVATLHSDAGKLFAGLYALFCGVVFIAVSGILVAPFAHRVLHGLHLEGKDKA
jgi:hypothetical protein